MRRTKFGTMFNSRFKSVLSKYLRFVTLNTKGILLTSGRNSGTTQPFIVRSLSPVFLKRTKRYNNSRSLNRQLLKYDRRIMCITKFSRTSNTRCNRTTNGLLSRIRLVNSGRGNSTRFLIRALRRNRRFNNNFQIRHTNNFINRRGLQVNNRYTNSTSTLLLTTKRLQEMFIYILARTRRFGRFISAAVLVILTPIVRLR